MASIFDKDPNDLPPRESETRNKKRREPLTAYEHTQGKKRLYDMVQIAFDALEEAARTADHSTAVKAATAILDRAGFGPKSTVDVNTTIDLSNLSRAELAERARLVSERLRIQAGNVRPVLEMNGTVQ